jgi:hypothetical protein
VYDIGVAPGLPGAPGELSARIAELEQESDMERVLATNASILALSGVLAGALVHRRFLLVPTVVLAFLLQHASTAGVHRSRCSGGSVCGRARRSMQRSSR